MSTSADLVLRFQFATEEQQRRAATVGMWVFLSTEIMMFGGLFTTYSVSRLWYGNAFAHGSNLMQVSLGAINTAILLTSSFSMAMAVFSSHAGSRRATMLLLVTTMVLGAVFLGIKFYEYFEHFQESKFPGFNFRYDGPEANHVEMFFFFYYVMTGLHALHMIVGLGILSVIWYRVKLGTVNRVYNTPVEIAGLYWHFVDVVWVFLFPLFYLVGQHLK